VTSRKTFSRKNTTDREKARPSKRCVVCYKTIEGRRQCFGAPNVKQPYVLKNVSRHFTPSLFFKVRLDWIFEKLRHS